MIPVKKGDLKKKEILQTAETLFCKNGYETTSIQDILDVLHTSKGSFYHHYASKELLLEEICRLRADVLARNVSLSVLENSSPIENLNVLFNGMIPLTGEKMDFILMILPVFDLPEGRQIRFGYAESLSAVFRDMVIQEIRRGNETGDIFCPEENQSADIAFLILNELWYRICLIIIHKEKEGKNIVFSELMNIISFYRGTLERVLSAPFGSIRLMDLEDIRNLSEKIHQN